MHGDKRQEERERILAGRIQKSEFSTCFLVFAFLFSFKCRNYCNREKKCSLKLAVHFVTRLYISDFKRGHISILVATDVASRGIGQFIYYYLKVILTPDAVQMSSLISCHIKIFSTFIACSDPY